jgi:carbon-monoxide dehydrogenase medium subunit
MRGAMYEPEWRSPRTAAEALAILAGEGGNALVVAGGTDCAPLIAGGQLRPGILVDLSGVGDIGAVTETCEGENGPRVTVGALATHGELAAGAGPLESARALSAACRTVGAPQVRARGTIGGNLANASPAADGAVALVALGASAVVESKRDGRREVPLAEFFLRPGETVLRADELVTGAVFDRPSAGARGVYKKAGQRNALAIAVASVAVVHEPDEGTVRIALGSVAPTPVRATEAEGLFAGGWRDAAVKAPDRREFLREVAAAAARAAAPIDDVRASAWYRTVLVEVLAKRALEETCGQMGR